MAAAPEFGRHGSDHYMDLELSKQQPVRREAME
jgi:hypothetical protein